MSVYRAEAPWRMRGLEPGSGLSQRSVHGPNLRNHETDLHRPRCRGQPTRVRGSGNPGQVDPVSC